MNVIAIFDIGKTDKKVFLFNENYQIVWEKSVILLETVDEDGFPCENIVELRNWIFYRLAEINDLKQYVLKAVNFSTYLASFVHVDHEGNALTPLYDYLKPFPKVLKKNFHKRYGCEKDFALLTASPVAGELNSGMQIYSLKEKNPDLFREVKYCLQIPQYLSSLLTSQYFTDITSIGCQTNLWDYSKMNYHEWITKEDIAEKIPPLKYTEETIKTRKGIAVGIGLHNRSSTIIPYIINFTEPFLLLSTGTWIISINPFNDHPLTLNELENDCFCYLQYKGKPMKGARLFAGIEHDTQVRKIARHFKKPAYAYKEVVYDKCLVSDLRASNLKKDTLEENKKRNWGDFKNFESAYHQLMLDLITQQIFSTQLVIHNSPVKKVFVEGGFSKNAIYMNLLAEAFPDLEVYASSTVQASALGAALAIHENWNQKTIPKDLIDLKFYKFN